MTFFLAESQVMTLTFSKKNCFPCKSASLESFQIDTFKLKISLYKNTLNIEVCHRKLYALKEGNEQPFFFQINNKYDLNYRIDKTI